MQLQYLSKKCRSPYVQYIRLARLMTRNARVLSPMESPSENQKDCKKRWISHLNINVFHSTRDSFIALLKEAVDFYINNPIKSTVFHPPSFYRFSEQVLQNMYDMFGKFNVLIH